MRWYPERRSLGTASIPTRRRARGRRTLACEALEPRSLLSTTGGTLLLPDAPDAGAMLPYAQAQSSRVAADLLNLAEPAGTAELGPVLAEGLSADMMNYDSAGRVGVIISATDPQGLVDS